MPARATLRRRPGHTMKCIFAVLEQTRNYSSAPSLARSATTRPLRMTRGTGRSRTETVDGELLI